MAIKSKQSKGCGGKIRTPLDKVKELIVYIINLPIYYISVLLPKEKNVWVFGAWFGEKYSDNSRHLFEYINKNEKGIKAIWIAKNKYVVYNVRKKGYKAYHAYSFKGYYYTLISKIGIVSSGRSDLNNFAFAGDSRRINLWHGTALKKIMYDDKIAFDGESKLSYFFPFLKKVKYDLLIATSSESKNKFVSAFRESNSKVFVTGYPRNDTFNNQNTSKNSVLEGIYMPTFRSDIGSTFIPFFIEWARQIEQILAQENIVLWIKLHYCDVEKIENLNYSFSNIKIVKDSEIDDDIYSFIANKDFLITDYSSIYFDFLLTDRPIIFFPYDKEEYLTKDRELYYDYDEVTPGPKVYNVEGLKTELINISKGVDNYKEDRKRVNKVFNNHFDGDNSKRVYEQIMLLLENEK